jgi:conjugative relaxase-like TrwC/TraI family protein
VLTVAKVGGGRANYYTSLAAEDYYAGEELSLEPGGYWIGEGAERLKLAGRKMNGETFRHLFDGFSPDGKEKFVHNAGKYDGSDRDRMPGYDLCFAMPKSVSLCWAVGSPEVRAMIERAHQAAVKATIAEIEELAQIRKGKGGKVKESAGLVVAVFQHATARQVDAETLPDMHLHSHCVVMNTGIGEKSRKTAALNGLDFLNERFAKEYGARFRNHGAKELIKCGFELERKGDSFEIKGVKEELIEHCSKRAKQIAEEAPREESTAKQKLKANHKTRESKGDYDPKDLLNHWTDEARKFGFTWQSVEKLRGADVVEVTPAERLKLVRDAAQELTKERLVFTRRELEQRAVAIGTGKGADAGEIKETAAQYLKHEAKYVLTETKESERRGKQKEVNGQPHTYKENYYTTHNSDVAERLRAHKEEQRKERQRERGAEKQISLTKARESFELAGYRVMGVTWSNEKAAKLEEGTGIKSYTISRLVADSKYKEPDKNKPGFARKAVAIGLQATGVWSKAKKRNYLGEDLEPKSKLVHEVKFITGQISKKHRDYLNRELDERKRATERQERAITSNTVLIIDATPGKENRTMRELIATAQVRGAVVFYAHETRLPDFAEKLDRAKQETAARVRTPDDWKREAREQEQQQTQRR